MAKRYVLLLARDPLSAADTRDLESVLVGRFGKIKVISVECNPRALIIKTDEPTVRLLRGTGDILGPGGLRLTPSLTSGAIGKLKKRAKEVGDNGKIHE